MKKIFFMLCLAFVCALYGCTGTPSLENNTTPEIDVEIDNDELDRKKLYAISTVNSLRLRSKASTSSSTVGYLDKDDAVPIIAKQGNFIKTVYKNKYAYVHSSYCTVMKIDYTGDEIEDAISLGCELLGFPYVWGSQRYHWGNGKLNSNFVFGEFDCSAFVQYVYYISNNVILDVTSRTQAYNGTKIDKTQLKRGDLMFFTNESRQNKVGNERIGHVGIYFGNNYILHTASDYAVLEPISKTRWSFFVTARRVL